jgi:hypothetical protein
MFASNYNQVLFHHTVSAVMVLSIQAMEQPSSLTCQEWGEYLLWSFLIIELGISSHFPPQEHQGLFLPTSFTISLEHHRKSLFIQHFTSTVLLYVPANAQPFQYPMQLLAYGLCFIGSQGHPFPLPTPMVLSNGVHPHLLSHLSVPHACFLSLHLPLATASAILKHLSGDSVCPLLPHCKHLVTPFTHSVLPHTFLLHAPGGLSSQGLRNRGDHQLA